MGNYKGNLSASGTIMGSLIAQAGPQGETGKEGYTPIKGVDYYTEAEKQEFVQAITNEIEQIIEPQEESRQLNEQERIINENARLEKEIERQTSELTRITNEEIRQRNEEIRKIQEAEREESENRRVETFSQMQEDIKTAIGNIEDMTEAYDANAAEKTNNFNNNATSKTEIFDANVTEKTNSFDQNAADKIVEFDENARAKIDEYNANVQVIEPRIVELETQVAELETENENIKNQFPTGQAEGESITLEDSAGGIEFKKFKVGGNSKQDGTPTPETPIEIQNVNGSANTIITNENLLYDGFAKDFVERINNSDKANITIINGKKYLYFLSSVGYVAGQDFKEHKQYFIKGIFKEKTKYTFSAKIMLSAARKEVNIAMRYTDGSLGYIMLNENATANEELDFSLTSDPNKTLYSITVSYQSGGTFIDLSTVTLKEGGTADYIENKTQKFTFPLSEGQKMPIGSYPADDGVYHKRRQIVLNGTENWGRSSAMNGAMFTLNDCINAKPFTDIQNLNVLSSHFIRGTGYESTSAYGTFWYNYAGTGLRFIYNDVTIDKWKSYLSEQYANGTPVTVEYELAEEVIEPYTEEQQKVYDQIKKSHSYKNITHIFSTDEIKPINKVIYRKDWETLDKNKEERLLALENAVLGGN